MLRYDEEIRNSSHKIKGHIKVWEHLGTGRLSCSVVDVCYR
jgi:hypothetical protein